MRKLVVNTSWFFWFLFSFTISYFISFKSKNKWVSVQDIISSYFVLNEWRSDILKLLPFDFKILRKLDLVLVKSDLKK